MAISTADCKALLVQQYPNTQAKAWKRISKKKDASGAIVREFMHPQHPSVHMHEVNGQLSIIVPVTVATLPISFAIYRYQTTDAFYNVYFAHQHYDDDEDSAPHVTQALAAVSLGQTLRELEAPHYSCDPVDAPSIYQALRAHGFVYDKALLSSGYDVFDPFTTPVVTQKAAGNALTLYQYLNIELKQPLNATAQMDALAILQSLPHKEVQKLYNVMTNITFAPNSWLLHEIVKEQQDRINYPNKVRNIVQSDVSSMIKRHLGLG